MTSLMPTPRWVITLWFVTIALSDAFWVVHGVPFFWPWTGETMQEFLQVITIGSLGPLGLVCLKDFVNRGLDGTHRSAE